MSRHQAYYAANRAAGLQYQSDLTKAELPESMDRALTANAQSLVDAALRNDRTAYSFGIQNPGLVELIRNAEPEKRLGIAKNMLDPKYPDRVIGHNGNGASQDRLLRQLETLGGTEMNYSEFQGTFNKSNFTSGLKAFGSSAGFQALKQSRRGVGEAYRAAAQEQQELSVKLGYARYRSGGGVSDQFKQQIAEAKLGSEAYPTIAKVVRDTDLADARFGSHVQSGGWRSRFAGAGPVRSSVQTTPDRDSFTAAASPSRTTPETQQARLQKSYTDSTLSLANRYAEANTVKGMQDLAVLIQLDGNRPTGQPSLDPDSQAKLAQLRSDSVMALGEKFASQGAAGLRSLKDLVIMENKLFDAKHPGALSEADLQTLRGSLKEGYGNLVRSTAITYAKKGDLKSAYELLDREKERSKSGAPDVVPESFEFRKLRRELKGVEPEKPVIFERYSTEEISHKKMRPLEGGPQERRHYLGNTLQLQFNKLVQSGEHRTWSDYQKALTIHPDVSVDELRALSAAVRDGSAPLFKNLSFSREQFAAFLDLAAKKREYQDLI